MKSPITLFFLFQAIITQCELQEKHVIRKSSVPPSFLTYLIYFTVQIFLKSTIDERNSIIGNFYLNLLLFSLLSQCMIASVFPQI